MSNVAAGKDTDDEGEKLNDVEKALGKMGIKLRNSKKEWRNFEEVIDEVASKWKDFEDTERSQIATAIAGTRQQEIFRALMNNYEQVIELQKVSADSAGSASERMETYLGSVEAKTNELKATWEEFITSLNQSESWKGFLDILIWLLNNIPTLIGFGTAILTLIAAIKAQTIITGLVAFSMHIKEMILGTTGLIANFKVLGAILSGNTKVVTAHTLAQTKEAITTELVRQGMDRETASLWATKIAEDSTTTSTVALTAAFSALMAVVAAGALIVTGFIMAEQKHQQAVEQSIKTMSENVNKIEEEENELNNLIDKYDEIYNSTQSISEKKEKYKEIQDQLVNTYKDEADGIDIVNGKYDEQIEKLKEIEKRKQIEKLNEYRGGYDALVEKLFTQTTQTIWDEGLTNVARNGKGDDHLANVMYDAMKEAGLKLEAGGRTWSTLSGNRYKLQDFRDIMEEKIQNMEITGNDAQRYYNIINKEGMAWEKSIAGDTEGIPEAQRQFNEKLFLETKYASDASYKEFEKYEDLLKERKNKYTELEEAVTEEEKARLRKEITELEKQISKTQSDSKVGLNYVGVDNYYNSQDQYKISDNQKQLMKNNWDFSESGIKYNPNKRNYDDMDEVLYAFDYNTTKNSAENLKAKQKELEKAIAKNKPQEEIDKINKEIEGYQDSLSSGYASLIEAFDGNEAAMKQLRENLSGNYGVNISKINLSNSNMWNEWNGIGGKDASEDAKDRWLSGINASLADLGVNINDTWLKELEKDLKTGEKDIDDFYEAVKKRCDLIGVDLDDITDKRKKAVTGIDNGLKLSDQYGEYSSGTDTKFSQVTDEIENLQSIKSKVTGGSAKYKDMRELVDHYDKLNDKVQQTGDIMSITGDDIQDVMDDIVDTVNDDLDKIIENAQKTESQLEDVIKDTQKALDKGLGKSSKITEEFAEGVEEGFEDATKAIEEAGADADLADFIDTTAVAGDLDIILDKIKEIGTASDEASQYAQALGLALLYASGENLALLLDNIAIGFQNLSTEEWNDIVAKMSLDEETLQLWQDTLMQDESILKVLESEGLLNDEEGNLKLTSENLSSVLPALINNFSSLEGNARAAAGAIISAAYSQGVMNDAINGASAETVANTSGKTISTAKTYANAAKQEATVRKSGLKNLQNGNLDGKKDKSGGSGNKYTADDAADDLKEILNDIEDYERDIEADLEDQTEELINHYNLEKNKLDTLREELDYYDDIYDVTENTTKWLDTQLKILDEESKKVAEIQDANVKIDAQRQKIFKENSKYNVESWFDSEGNETLAYGNAINNIEYQKEQIQKETAAKMRDVYNSVANSTNKDAISDAKEKIKIIEEEGDLKIKELDKERDRIENIYDSVDQLNEAWKDNQEAIRDALKEMNDRVKSIRDELIDDIMEQLERAVDKMNTSIEKDVTRLEQLKQVQESYNNILNDTLDTQQELADELKANMDSYQYLDEEMRQLMFNEDDYKKLNGVLEGVQKDIADIWEDHYNQIQNLTEDEMYKAEYITNETERQLAAKQKEYELAKAELDVAKAQTNLQNVMNERDTRIFANGEWQWVANPDNVKSAQEQLMDAQREKTKIEREAEQQELIDFMDKMIDSDNLQIDKNNDLLEKIQEAIEQETEEVKSIEEALLNADKANLPALTTTLVGALGKDGGYMKELLGEINHSQVELAMALRGQTIAQAEAQLKSNNMSKSEFTSLVSRLGYSFDEATGMITTQDGSFAAHYAGWTKKSLADIQTTTAENGVQTTGQNANANSSNSGGAANASGFPRTGHVSTSSLPLRIRSGAGTNYKILGTMPKGAAVTITGEANSGWAKVSYNGINGYASKQYLTYDQGGLADGLGYLPKATIKPERVLSPRQTKAFENLVNNLTTNPVLNALSKVPSVASRFDKLSGDTNNSKNYYFSDFTVKADDIEQFINSIETIMPMKNK